MDTIQAFYKSHGVHVKDINDLKLPYRFVRLHPAFDAGETRKMLEDELKEHNATLRRVEWMPDTLPFFATEADVPLSQLSTFREGRIHGQDVSSGVAVAALMSSCFDIDRKSMNDRPMKRILDLCCAPGLKLCALADLLKDSNATVVGVDIEQNRLNTTKSIIDKYQLQHSHPRIRLYYCDGTTFGLNEESLDALYFDSLFYSEEPSNRKRKNRSARAREKKKLKGLRNWDSTGSADEVKIDLFDGVLVDAECSTDGSLKHIQKQMEYNRESKLELLTREQGLTDLVNLQKRLLENGFKLLRPGGVLVYSTCSLSIDQNEGVLKWLLDTYSSAEIIPLRIRTENPCILEGQVKGSLRFLPDPNNQSNNFVTGGGFFVAKIRKVDSQSVSDTSKIPHRLAFSK